MIIDEEEVLFRKEDHEYECILDLIDDGIGLFMLRLTDNHKGDIKQIPITMAELQTLYDVGLTNK